MITVKNRDAATLIALWQSLTDDEHRHYFINDDLTVDELVLWDNLTDGTWNYKQDK
jgi:hypothetical protein